MTIKDALTRRIPRIRLANWGPTSYLRLPLLKEGGHGPWAELYDPPAQKSLRVRPGSQRIMMTAPNTGQDGYEPYLGPPDGAERHHLNFAKTYAES